MSHVPADRRARPSMHRLPLWCGRCGASRAHRRTSRPHHSGSDRCGAHTSDHTTVDHSGSVVGWCASARRLASVLPAHWRVELVALILPRQSEARGDGSSGDGSSGVGSSSDGSSSGGGSRAVAAAVVAAAVVAAAAVVVAAVAAAVMAAVVAAAVVTAAAAVAAVVAAVVRAMRRSSRGSTAPDCACLAPRGACCRQIQIQIQIL